jgi:hypothetical protein
MFILLINYVVLSYRRRKGTAVLGGEQTFCGLLPEVVATGAGICDKALMRRQNRVAKQFKMFFPGIKKGTPLSPMNLLTSFF